jgi:hypothetical protein
VTEGEARHSPGPVVAPVADQQPFGVLEPALFRHGVQDRAVGLGDRDRDRQAAARFDPPQQHVREGLAHGLPGQPAAADRRHLVRPRHEHRHAGVHHHHGPVVHLRDPAHQFVLITGQGEPGTVEALALGGRPGPDHHDGRVRVPRGLHRLAEQHVAVRRGHDAEPDGYRALGPVIGQQRDHHLGFLPFGQVDRGPDLARPHHDLHRVGGHARVPARDLPAVDREREQAHPAHADQVRAAVGGPVAGTEQDRAAAAPADARRQAVPPGEHGRGAVLRARQLAVGGAKFQSDARLAGVRIAQRRQLGRGHDAPGHAARPHDHPGLRVPSGQRRRQRVRRGRHADRRDGRAAAALSDRTDRVGSDQRDAADRAQIER